MARWALTVRRVRFLAASCSNVSHPFLFFFFLFCFLSIAPPDISLNVPSWFVMSGAGFDVFRMHVHVWNSDRESIQFVPQ